MILDKIKKPNDIHKIPLAEFPQLAEEIRSFLIEFRQQDRRTSGIQSWSGRTYTGTA